MKPNFVFTFLLIIIQQLFAQDQKEIFLADPTIYVSNGKYYLTGTNGSDANVGFPILVSKDLKNWSASGEASNELPLILSKGKHTFGTQGFWAPQLLKEGNYYYLTYTANEQTVLAKSSTLLGPYQQDKVAPIDASEKNIDSYLFKDQDGKYYLYHVRFNKGNYLWVAEFDFSKGKIKPETLKQCFPQTEAWEATPAYPSDPIMEGPTVLKLKNKYYLFYSANHYLNIDYAVGYAVADSPFGPWIKQQDSPIIHRSLVGENGSGHGDIFEGLDGQLYYVYHVHYDTKQVTPRRTRIVPLLKKWEEQKGLYKFSVDTQKVITPVYTNKK